MLDFNQLLKTSSLRKSSFKIKGLGEVELTELSGSEVVELLAATTAIPKEDQAATQEHLAFWASRILKGSKPTSQEVKKIQNNLSANCIADIYRAGMEANGGDKEEHAKN
jgi:hypothetical protein